MNNKFNFEKLEIWQLSMELNGDIYKATKSFPRDELFGLTMHIRRSSISIASNIAEGSGRHHKQDFVRFLRISLGSAYECITQLFIAREENYVSLGDFQNLYQKTQRICKMANKLISSLSDRK